MKITNEQLAKVLVIVPQETVKKVMPYLPEASKEATEKAYNEILETINEYGIKAVVDDCIGLYDEKTKEI